MEPNRSGEIFAVVRTFKSLCATKPFQTGEVIAPFKARAIHATPSRMTVQLEAGKHILLYPSLLQYVNHSCNPNVFFDTKRRVLRCIRPIAEGGEIRFFYPSTEWDMDEPFQCNCKEPNCLGLIKGAAHLPPHILDQYELSEDIQRQLEARGQTSF